MTVSGRRIAKRSERPRERWEMTEIGGTTLRKTLQNAEVRMHVLETALHQVAENPSDDPAALKKIAATALEKAGKARSTG
jgi:hypothetical protein